MVGWSNLCQRKKMCIEYIMDEICVELWVASGVV